MVMTAEQRAEIEALIRQYEARRDALLGEANQAQGAAAALKVLLAAGEPIPQGGTEQ